MYIKGDVKIVARDMSPELHLWDSRSMKSSAEPRMTVYLPAIPDEWVIGGPEHVKQLITDLVAALDWMERNRG